MLIAQVSEALARASPWPDIDGPARQTEMTPGSVFGTKANQKAVNYAEINLLVEQ